MRDARQHRNDVAARVDDPPVQVAAGSRREAQSTLDPQGGTKNHARREYLSPPRPLPRVQWSGADREANSPPKKLKMKRQASCSLGLTPVPAAIITTFR